MSLLNRPDGLGAGGVIGIPARLQLSTLLAEARQVGHTKPLHSELQSGRQDAESVFHAAAKVNGRSPFEIFRRAGNFADAEAKVNALGKHLVVEDEVVGVFQQRQLGQHFTAEGAIPGVILRELDSQKKVLEGRKKAVGSVLVVGMNHDDDVGASGQSFAITGLLVAAVTIIAIVLEDVQTETAGNIDGLIGTAVIDQDADVNEFGKFSDGRFESLLRVVSGHDDRD